ncbi:hypothetical protein [Streptomyces sp. NPDC004267]|uniref:hypothetical protein n=1 Tax=Streptomyces sp. NPDC004267 TaxID=3364694 RepID=UPI003677968D
MRARHVPLTLILLSLLVSACPQTALAGGAGENALGMSVTVNTLRGAAAVTVRTGGLVVKKYRLVNRGEADLYGVGVSDPGVPGGRVGCPRRTLGALRSMVCTARFRAVPGRHTATARATGSIPSLGSRVTATARSGYEGVAGALVLTEAVRVGPPLGAGRAVALRSAAVTYTVTNPGNRTVYAVRLADPVLGAVAGSVACVAELAPGAVAGCSATVRRPPGTYRSAGLASGSDRVTTVDEHGDRVAAPLLTARAAAAFRLPAPPPPPVRSRPRPSPAPSTTAAGQPSGPPSARPGSSVPARPGATAAAPGAAAGAGAVQGAVGAAPGAPGVAAGPAAGAAAGAAGAGAAGAGAAAGAAGAGAAGAGAAAAPGEAAAAAAAAAAAEALALPGGVPPGAAAPGTAAAGAAPPGAAPATQPAGQAPANSAAQPPPGTAPANQQPQQPRRPTARTPVAAGQEGILPRLHRRARQLPHLGMTLMLLLLLIPAAVAAALLGSRRI